MRCQWSLCAFWATGTKEDGLWRHTAFGSYFPCLAFSMPRVPRGCLLTSTSRSRVPDNSIRSNGAFAVTGGSEILHRRRVETRIGRPKQARSNVKGASEGKV